MRTTTTFLITSSIGRSMWLEKNLFGKSNQLLVHLLLLSLTFPRTFIWIVLIDTAFIIFNNLPPRMVTKEMTMQMASPESCFQASTSERCLEQIRHWMPDPTAICKITLRDAIETLCIKNLSSESQRRMAALGPLNLFAIVSGEQLYMPALIVTGY